MSKAFTKETDTEDDELEEADALPPLLKNYMTPTGFNTLKEEKRMLQNDERPKVVEVVAWAASNGDRSENGDYIYGKKRLREIDKRIRYPSKRLESAEVVDPERQQALEQVFFGATVCFVREDGSEQKVQIVGVDEADINVGKISWISPVAKALMKAREGESVKLRSPAGVETLQVISIEYIIPSSA